MALPFGFKSVLNLTKVEVGAVSILTRVSQVNGLNSGWLIVRGLVMT